MQQLVCKHCGYVWHYKGDKKRISCSKCKTSIRLSTSKVIRKYNEAFLSLPLAERLNKFLLAKLIGMARAEGQDRIRLNINQHGDVYLD